VIRPNRTPFSRLRALVVFAIAYTQAIRAFVDQGDDALRSELERWEPEARKAVANALAQVA
jgi:hypothetical protein